MVNDGNANDGERGNVLVVGAGLMGSGIAQTAATSGWSVTLYDTQPGALGRATAAIDLSLDSLVRKAKLTPDSADAARGRLSLATDLDAAAEADVVVEAVFEDVDIKTEIFAQLDRLCPPEALLASNTSAIPITRLAAATERPESVVGTHFFSPVPVMALCEVVRGERTSEVALSRATAFVKGLGKTAVVVRRDIPGFVTTRLITALILEAVRLVEAGVATPEDIDTACRLGFGHRMGPLATCDLIGADVLRNAARVMDTDAAGGVFEVPELLNQLVADGKLGRKSGEGFYLHGGSATN